MAAWILACCSAFASVALVSPATAQTVPDAERTSIEVLKGRLSDALARQDLEPTLKARIAEAYKNAITALESASTLPGSGANSRAMQRAPFPHCSASWPSALTTR